MLNRRKFIQKTSFTAASAGVFSILPFEIWNSPADQGDKINIASRTGEPVLQWDDKAGKFTNSDKANGLIKPEYRAPWSFPEI
jgi:hypothetical protein